MFNKECMETIIYHYTWYGYFYLWSIRTGHTLFKDAKLALGIGPMDVIATQNMDYVLEDEVEKKVQQAIETGLHLVEIW